MQAILVKLMTWRNGAKRGTISRRAAQLAVSACCLLVADSAARSARYTARELCSPLVGGY
jgi:hypothetical protein